MAADFVPKEMYVIYNYVRHTLPVLLFAERLVLHSSTFTAIITTIFHFYFHAALRIMHPVLEPCPAL